METKCQVSFTIFSFRVVVGEGVCWMFMVRQHTYINWCRCLFHGHDDRWCFIFLWKWKRGIQSRSPWCHEDEMDGLGGIYKCIILYYIMKFGIISWNSFWGEDTSPEQTMSYCMSISMFTLRIIVKYTLLYLM